MRRWVLVVPACALVCVGCGKELNSKFCAAHPDDERCSASPDAPGRSLAVEHLTPATEQLLTSDADVVVSAIGTVIDTTAGTITPAWPGAVILGDVAQDDGPNVMVVQVRSLTIENAADAIEVSGERPLVLVAARTIDLQASARIDVSATGQAPGPGGYASGLGPGAGSAGAASGLANGGGGGASYNSQGGRGGNPAGGARGTTYGAASRLEGGSGGGVPSVPGACTVHGGAGGGALQLTALDTLVINGRINAGGSGGQGGLPCGSDGSGGAGGGSGGMIFLEARDISGTGVLGALGGGGGEGGSQSGVYTGVAGTDASTETAGVGGASDNSGGDGGSAEPNGGDGVRGEDVGSDANGGGGAGGGGRIDCVSETGAPSGVVARPALKYTQR